MARAYRYAQTHRHTDAQGATEGAIMMSETMSQNMALYTGFTSK